MKPSHYLTYPAILLVSASLTSCSLLKKNPNAEGSGILGQLPADSESSETTIDRLKTIAHSPNSMLPGGFAADTESEDLALFAADHDPIAHDPIAHDPIAHDPIISWSANGFNPRSIQIGDVFTDHSGPILKKSASIAEAITEEQRDSWLKQISKSKTTRVPMTLSPTELAALKETVNSDVAFPTRSVALDFKTITRTTNRKELEDQLTELASGKKSNFIPGGAPPSVQSQLEAVKAGLKKGEQYFVITGVTESDFLTATYPGAPVGTRDADPICNAVEALFPHLDELEAEKSKEAIVLSRPPRVYWEFEARELKLKGDEFVIDSRSLARN